MAMTGAERTARHREKKRIAASVPYADEWCNSFSENYPEHEAELKAYLAEFSERVAGELGREIRNSFDEGQLIDEVACALLGFKKNWVRKVTDPPGEIVSGRYFPDVLGESIVSGAHFHGFKKSETFVKAYQELLEILDLRYGKQNTEHARDIKLELSGDYVLKPEVPQEQGN
jgi:hypothetical protein